MCALSHNYAFSGLPALERCVASTHRVHALGIHPLYPFASLCSPLCGLSSNVVRKVVIVQLLECPF